MYGDYLVLCGRAWAEFGALEAGLELIRALASPDANVRVLARTLLEESNGGSRELIAEALADEQISASNAHLCSFKKDSGGKLWNRDEGTWSATGLA